MDWMKVAASLSASDAWSIGQTIPTLFDVVPRELASVQRKLLNQEPSGRPKLQQVLANGVFAHPYVEAMLTITNLSLKSHTEMVLFFNGLAPILVHFAIGPRIFHLIPALKAGITRSISPDKRPEDCREIVSAVLPILSEVRSNFV